MTALSFGAWLRHVDEKLGIRVEPVTELVKWHLEGGTVADPNYPLASVRFVAEARGGAPLSGERPLIWCAKEVHSNMIGLCRLTDGLPRFLGMAKAEAGHAHMDLYGHGERYKNKWAVTCAHQFTPRPTNPLAWLPDDEECRKRGLTVLAKAPVFADPGMLMKKYNLGLVYTPEDNADALAEEAGPFTRWLSPREMASLRQEGRTTEFLFTTAGLLAGRSLKETLAEASPTSN